MVEIVLASDFLRTVVVAQDSASKIHGKVNSFSFTWSGPTGECRNVFRVRSAVSTSPKSLDLRSVTQSVKYFVSMKNFDTGNLNQNKSCIILLVKHNMYYPVWRANASNTFKQSLRNNPSNFVVGSLMKIW